MSTDISVLTAAGTIAIAALGLALGVLFDAVWGRRSIHLALLAGAIESAVGWVSWLLVVVVAGPSLDATLIVPIGALAGIASVVVCTVPRSNGYAPGITAAFGAAWTVLVFSPVAVALFSVDHGVLATSLRTLDLGGVLPVLVAAGSAVAVSLVVGRRDRAPRLPAPSAALIGTVIPVVWLLWAVWLVSIELVLGEATLRILLNTLVAPPAAAIAWIVVQRIRTATTSAGGIASGVVCGLVAITPGAGYLHPLGAVGTAAIASTAAALVAYGLIARTARRAWFLPSVTVVGAGTGVVLLGAFAAQSGLIFTGQPEVLIAQTASVIGVVLVSALVSWPLVLGARALDTRARRRGRMLPA
ncbi:ammonium transporter [Marisediminicola senii]|uniref:ammonium transporter n=1 Tax=Marisediminicola senii TaxID=2711233 RepID=UPI0013EA0CE1|nr:ammonium transporter [Marisediminicola senii]